jgi:2-amino-4-hydroxy-6-hydroxymethyldihydropteridine diphosphokinase
VSVICYIGLGANLGDAPATLQAALTHLAALPLTALLMASSTYRSAPVDAQGPDYFNAVAALNTQLAPCTLLVQLQHIEQLHGRQRPFHHAPRTLDLDVLLYGDERINTPTLTVPHPRAHERAFVLHPLAQIAPHLVLPGHGRVVDLLGNVAHQVLQLHSKK